jgi:predicted  nucleic acid-binding Zn-ribbon protein
LTTADLKSQLSSLIKLQAIDSEVYILNSEKSKKPDEIKALEGLFEAKKAGLKELEEKSLCLQKEKKEKELELAAKESATVKLQGQLYSLKTNKEYQTMLGQIEDSKADASLIEDKILELLEQVDRIKVEVEKEKLKIKEDEKLFLADKAKVDFRVKEIDDRLSQLDSLRKQAIPGIDPKILAQYERILLSRDGLAIVTVKGNSCGGCNMFVPPQVINLIKMYERIVTCEICNRMLYIEETA